MNRLGFKRIFIWYNFHQILYNTKKIFMVKVGQERLKNVKMDNYFGTNGVRFNQIRCT